MYSEFLDNETGSTAAGFWRRARDWFAAHGITIERALTDNGACYRSHDRADALAETGVTHKGARTYRPQTNGNVERFHRIRLEEWAYIRPWRTEHQRHQAYNGRIHFYNHLRPTARSDGDHRPAPPGTTSPSSTPNASKTVTNMS